MGSLGLRVYSIYRDSEGFGRLAAPALKPACLSLVQMSCVNSLTLAG